MLMAVFERTREMGILAAMGMKGRQIMSLFVLEGALIGLIGAIIGCMASWLLVAAVGRTGIDFSSVVEGVEDAGEIYALMGDRLYPYISGTTIVLYGLAAVIVGAFAALYPAWQAAKNEPAESLHYV